MVRIEQFFQALVARLSPTQAQFVKFALVGAFATLVDIAVLYLSFEVGFGLYSGQVIAYIVAASVQWSLNRQFTFRYRGTMRAHHQWARSVSLMTVGAAVNYAIYAALVTFVALIAAYPFIGVIAGAFGSLTVNFNVSRRFVFHR